jgi:hypothetical protein
LPLFYLAVAALVSAATIPFWIKSGAFQPPSATERSTQPSQPKPPLVAASIGRPAGAHHKHAVRAKRRHRLTAKTVAAPVPVPPRAATKPAKPVNPRKPVIAKARQAAVKVAAAKRPTAPKKPVVRVATSWKSVHKVAAKHARMPASVPVPTPTDEAAHKRALAAAAAHKRALARLHKAEQMALIRQNQASLWAKRLSAARALLQQRLARADAEALGPNTAVTATPRPKAPAPRSAQPKRPAATYVRVPAYTGPGSGPVEPATATYSPPAPTIHPSPTVPLALLNREMDVVYVAIIAVSATGDTTVTTTHSTGIPQLDSETVRKLRYWKFQPATEDGKPTVGHYRVVIRFQVRLDNGLDMAKPPVIPVRPKAPGTPDGED